MSYRCTNPETYEGKVVGNGQCVKFPQVAAGLPPSSAWKEGVAVRGNNIAFGTAIATFVNGKYPNLSTGNHAAIYISQDQNGINVWDQWTGKAVSKRYIRFKGAKTTDPSNNGDAFSVIE